MDVTVRSTTDDESVAYQITGIGYQNPLDGTTEHDIEIHGSDADVEEHYEFVVDGHLEPGERANISAEDDVTDGVASGFVVGGTDDYRFTGAITRFEVDDGATVKIDGEEIDPSNAIAAKDTWVIEDETDGARQHQVDGRITDFDQTGGESDWVLVIGGKPTAFGGPSSPVGGEFTYATTAQVQGFVECALEEMAIELDGYVHKDQLTGYVQRAEMESILQDAFDRASVSISTKGITLNPPEE